MHEYAHTSIMAQNIYLLHSIIHILAFFLKPMLESFVQLKALMNLKIHSRSRRKLFTFTLVVKLKYKNG